MTPELAPSNDNAEHPDWGDLADYSYRFVRHEFPRFGEAAWDISQAAVAATYRRHQTGALRLAHGGNSLYAYVRTATYRGANDRARQLRRRQEEVVDVDVSDVEIADDRGALDFATVEQEASRLRLETLPVECPLCVGQRRSCGKGPESQHVVRGVARAALDEILRVGDLRLLQHGQVDPNLRRTGAEAGALPPAAVDRSSAAGTRFTRTLVVCTAHLLFQALLPLRRFPEIVVDAALAARDRNGRDWGTRREGAMAAWADEWHLPWPSAA